MCYNESLLHHHSAFGEMETGDYFKFNCYEHKYLNILE